MKVFISYDFNWYAQNTVLCLSSLMISRWNTGQAVQIGQHLASYASMPAQLKIAGSVSRMLEARSMSNYATRPSSLALLVMVWMSRLVFHRQCPVYALLTRQRAQAMKNAAGIPV